MEYKKSICLRFDMTYSINKHLRFKTRIINLEQLLITFAKHNLSQKYILMEFLGEWFKEIVLKFEPGNGKHDKQIDYCSKKAFVKSKVKLIISKGVTMRAIFINPESLQIHIDDKNKILKKKNFRQNCFEGSSFSAFSKGQKSTSVLFK